MGTYKHLYVKIDKWQSHFLASGSNGDGQWIVPITLCCGSYDNRKSFLLETRSTTLDIETRIGAEDDGTSAICSWIKLNIDQTGFYRVKYDEDLAARLRDAIENKYLSATDRFGKLKQYFLTHTCFYCCCEQVA